jgi:hypothetical protein
MKELEIMKENEYSENDSLPNEFEKLKLSPEMIESLQSQIQTSAYLSNGEVLEQREAF